MLRKPSSVTVWATLLTTDNFFHVCIQSFRLEFSSHGGCYDFLVREKDRCEEFLNLFIGELFCFFLCATENVLVIPFTAKCLCMVATGQKMAREKILQGQGKVRTFYFESGKIDNLKKSQ